MKVDMKNTLRWHMGRPLVTKGEVLQASMPDVVKHQKVAQGSMGKATPECEAITFYMLNHALGELRQQVGIDTPLNPDQQKLADMYFTELAVPTARLYWYLIAICTRESRHAKNYGAFYTKMESLFSPETVAFHKEVRGTSSSSAVSKLYSMTPAVTLEEYAGKFLPWVFHKGSYSGGYGGKKWGIVADCLANFVNGNYSAEMMMDVGWTLCHNNGPIFNKQIFYNMYTHDLVRLLDVQRAGMIPALVEEVSQGATYFAAEFVTARHRDILKHAKKTLGQGNFGGFVEWDAVSKDAVHGNYGPHKAQQASAFAAHPKFYDSDVLVKAQKQAATEAAEKVAHDEKWYTIGQEKYPKVKRAQL